MAIQCRCLPDLATLDGHLGFFVTCFSNHSQRPDCWHFFSRSRSTGNSTCWTISPNLPIRFAITAVFYTGLDPFLLLLECVLETHTIDFGVLEDFWKEESFLWSSYIEGYPFLVPYIQNSRSNTRIQQQVPFPCHSPSTHLNSLLVLELETGNNP